MSTCETCRFWKVGVRNLFASEEKFETLAEPGHGICQTGPMAGHATPQEFGCNNYQEGAAEDHVETIQHDLEAWQIWVMVPCPDCQAIGNHGGTSDSVSTCNRCAGTANVRKYADGYVGDEQTREHPKEKELRLEALRVKRLAELEAELAAAAQPPKPPEPERVG